MVDYIVEPRSDKFLCDWAKETLANVDTDLTKKVEVCKLVTQSSIKTIYGEKRLTFEAVADAEMGNDDGLTSYATILCPFSCEPRFGKGQGWKVGVIG